MRYRATRVPALITFAGLLPNAIFSWLNAGAIACLEPAVSQTWHADPRFGIGVGIYAAGFVINRTSDWKLRSLRSDQQSAAYHVPRGGMFTYVSCANYFGELVQWGGWALATWSWAGLLWWLFALSTFIPRARQTHAWYHSSFITALQYLIHLFRYRASFPDYPSQRKALIPFVW
jgi:steroid 5-alpha reductase family enzyme